jgi:hypothetical protein
MENWVLGGPVGKVMGSIPDGANVMFIDIILLATPWSWLRNEKKLKQSHYWSRYALRVP